jgi:hypothetical protein
MAHASRLTVAFLAAAAVSWAASPCEENRGQSGLALAQREGRLEVAAVDEASAAAEAGVRVGDVVVQANGVVPRSCADWARAVREAGKDRKALLVLVDRGGKETPLALAAATWGRVVAEVPPPPAVEPPTVKTIVAKPPPEPLPPEAHVSVDEVTGALRALAPEDKPPRELAAYEHDLLRAHRQIETLVARRTAPEPVVEGLRTVLRYYDAAEVAWTAEEAQREKEKRPRHLPSSEGMAAPYFADSEAAVAIDQFPFLRDTVSRDPKPGLIESSGTWRPVQARMLLWDHGREELARLSDWLK